MEFNERIKSLFKKKKMAIEPLFFNTDSIVTLLFTKKITKKKVKIFISYLKSLFPIFVIYFYSYYS